MRAGRVPRPSSWWLVFGGGLAVRLAYWAVVTPDWVPVADADQYVLLARSLAAGEGFSLQFPQMAVHPTAFRPPLLPVVLTPAAWAGGDALWPLRLTMALVGSAAVVVVGRYVAALGGATAGWVAAGLVAFYPPLLANDTVTLTEPLAILLLVAALLSLDRDRWGWCGLAVGLLLLTRPNGYLVVLVLAVCWWVRAGRRRSLAFVGLVVLCVVPWMVRNQVQVGTLRLTTSDGFTLAATYSPQAQAAGGFVDPVFDAAFDEPRFRWAQFDEAAWSAALGRVAWEGLCARPTYVLEVVGSNALAYFEVAPGRNRWAEENDGRDWAVRAAALPLYWVVTLGGLAGLALRWRDRRWWPLVAVTTQYVALCLVLVAPPRLRAPFDVLCCVGLALGVAALLERRSGLGGADVAAGALGADDAAGVVAVGPVAQPGGARRDGVAGR